MQKSCAINLTTQLIKNFYTQSKTAVNLDILLNKNWCNRNISKNKMKSLQKRLAPYVKAVKAMRKRYNNCFKLIKKLGVLPIKIDLLNSITLIVAKPFFGTLQQW